MNHIKIEPHWKIQGWDGTTKLFEHRINVGQITDKRMNDLIKVVAAKISLSEHEIISGYAKKGTKAYSNYLEVQKLEGEKYMLSCGTSPYVTAVVVRE